MVKKISENFATHFPEKEVKGRFQWIQQKTIVWADPVPSMVVSLFPKLCLLVETCPPWPIPGFLALKKVKNKY